MFDKLDQLVEQSPNFGPHTVIILLILVSLEAVLSADNAIALAALVQGLNNVELEKKALDLGLVAAFIMRMVLIFAATWVVKYWQFELLGAIYLLWLAGKYFLNPEDEDGARQGNQYSSLWQLVPLIAVTDLAFSLDSVTTAIALADDRWLVITGGVIGILTLRFLAELFIKWLEEYKHLQDAGYLTVVFVGLRLLIRVINEAYVPPEWVMVSLIGLAFAWGFSEKVDATDLPKELATQSESSEEKLSDDKLERDANTVTPQ